MHHRTTLAASSVLAILVGSAAGAAGAMPHGGPAAGLAAHERQRSAVPARPAPGDAVRSSVVTGCYDEPWWMRRVPYRYGCDGIPYIYHPGSYAYDFGNPCSWAGGRTDDAAIDFTDRLTHITSRHCQS